MYLKLYFKIAPCEFIIGDTSQFSEYKNNGTAEFVLKSKFIDFASISFKDQH